MTWSDTYFWESILRVYDEQTRLPATTFMTEPLGCSEGKTPIWTRTVTNDDQLALHVWSARGSRRLARVIRGGHGVRRGARQKSELDRVLDGRDERA